MTTTNIMTRTDLTLKTANNKAVLPWLVLFVTVVVAAAGCKAQGIGDSSDVSLESTVQTSADSFLEETSQEETQSAVSVPSTVASSKAAAVPAASAAASSNAMSSVASKAPASSAASSKSQVSAAPSWGAGILFFDDFTADTTTKTRGWRDNRVVSGNRLVLPLTASSLYLTNFSGASSWLDYAVEASITVEPDEPLSGNSGATALIGHTSGGSNGYEIGLFFGSKTSHLRLYNRTNATQLATIGFAPERGREYRLKLVFSGNRILGFVDNTLYIDVSDGSNPVGSVGIRTGGYGCFVDWVTVREVKPEDLSAVLQVVD
jgi:hypothetical protein